jgi:hypothetical protein
VVRQVSEHPAAERTHQEAGREQQCCVELLYDRIGIRKEIAGEIKREGGVGVEVVPFDQIADRANENRFEPTSGVRVAVGR